MLRNSQTDWGWPSKVLHWVGALAVLVLLLHGWWMVHMAPRPERFANYMWHAAIGYDLLALLVLRLLWRWMNPVPAMPGDLKRWEVIAARTGHIGLYVLLFTSALTGWALAGTFKRPMTLDLLGVPTQAATAAEAHRNLMLTKALDLSAKRKQPVKLPLDPEEERRVA